MNTETVRAITPMNTETVRAITLMNTETYDSDRESCVALSMDESDGVDQVVSMCKRQDS